VISVTSGLPRVFPTAESFSFEAWQQLLLRLWKRLPTCYWLPRLDPERFSGGRIGGSPKRGPQQPIVATSPDRLHSTILRVRCQSVQNLGYVGPLSILPRIPPPVGLTPGNLAKRRPPTPRKHPLRMAFHSSCCFSPT